MSNHDHCRRLAEEAEDRVPQQPPQASFDALVTMMDEIRAHGLGLKIEPVRWHK